LTSLAAILSLALPVMMFAGPGAGFDAGAVDLYSLSGTVAAWDIQSLDYLAPLDDGAVVTSVVLGNREYVLALRPHSLRSDDFAVTAQVEGGEMVEVEPPEVTTYRGQVIGVRGSKVAASLVDGQLYALVRLGSGEDWFIEPYSTYDEFARETEHVVYRRDAVLPTGRSCGSDLLEHPAEADFGLSGEGTGDVAEGIGGPGETPLAQENAEVAIDADYEFFQANLNSISGTIIDIEKVLNQVEIIYDRDVTICYNLTHIIVRTTSNDPYTSSNPSTLLDQFRSEWLNNQGAIPRDLAHLMTGRNLNGGTIGIAWLNGVCNSYGYGLSQSRFSFNMSQRVALTAHEMGHNWSASHCDGNGDCHIMCSGLGGCQGLGLPNFGSLAVSEITSFKNSRPCLDAGCDEVLDLTEPDPGIPGQSSTISVRNAGANADVQFFFGFSAGSTPVPGCSGLNLGLNNARGLQPVQADASGIATLTVTVPSGASGRTAMLQAADLTNCNISDIETFTFP
jgi:hypothetical protein